MAEGGRRRLRRPPRSIARVACATACDGSLAGERDDGGGETAGDGSVDGYTDPYGEYLVGYSHGIRDYIRRDLDAPYLLGVYKNFSEVGQRRCFANQGQPCGPRGDDPPHAMPLATELPVLPASSIAPAPGSTTVRGTAGATLLPEFSERRRVDVRLLGPHDCHDMGYVFTCRFRNRVFIADRVDFGGTLGVQDEVLVLESHAGDLARATPDPSWGGGSRFERYCFVRSYGRVRQLGANNTACSGSPGAATCNGEYALEGEADFNTRTAGDYHVDPSCPYCPVHPPPRRRAASCPSEERRCTSDAPDSRLRS